MLKFPITELDVQALVDSQLTWEEEKQVRREMGKNFALKKHYDQIVKQKKLLVNWWKNETKKG
jgi:anti-sigma factor RsiW